MIRSIQSRVCRSVLALRGVARIGAAAPAVAFALYAVAPASAQVYSNGTSINIPDIGQANPNPSIITVMGGPERIGSIKVTLHNVTHGASGRCVVQLTAPNGQLITLSPGTTSGLSNTFQADVSFGQPQVTSTPIPANWTAGTFLPSQGNWGSIPGSNANGQWRLGIFQNFAASGVGGQVAGGWSLTLGADTGLVNVDFNNGASPTHTGAGLIGVAGDTWNVMPAHAGSEPAHSLVSPYSGATPVTIAYSGATGGFVAANHSFSATPFANLMSDYLYVAEGSTGTITLGGLTPNTPYDLILYSNPDLNSARSTRFTIDGVSQTAASLGTASSFIPGVNYVRFTSAAANNAGQLVIAMTAPITAGFDEAELNGLQIQPAPLTAPGQFCSQAAFIGNGTYFFTTAGSATDGPSEHAIGFGFNDFQVNQDVWFVYTASCSGTAAVSLCGSSFDTKIAIYNGATCPTGPDTAIAGNDDSATCGGNGLQSHTTFACVAGHQYLVRVGGFQANAGSVKMSISCDGSGCLTADLGVPGGFAGRDGMLDNNDFIAFISAFFDQTTCP